MPPFMKCSSARCLPGGRKWLSQHPHDGKFRWDRGALNQRQFAVPLCNNGIAVLAKRGMATAVAHDLAGLFALDVAVDPGHPRVDLVEQQSLATRLDVVGPLSHPRGRGLDPGHAAVARMPD